jgi:hypothetical protein
MNTDFKPFIFEICNVEHHFNFRIAKIFKWILSTSNFRVACLLTDDLSLTFKTIT